MDIRKDVQAVVDGILAGKILETFDRYYADDVVMSENGVETTNGKAANRAREEAFVANVTVHGCSVEGASAQSFGDDAEARSSGTS